VSDGRVTLLFGIHNHQPAGNFEGVLEDATRRAYQPFLEVVRAFPGVRLTVHCTGTLLEWMQRRAPTTFDLLGELAARGQIEFLTGGFYEPILAVLPDHDKVGQIRRLSDFLKEHFGVRPRGMWLAERVWEPHLPRALTEAGVEFVLVDDRHFALAGMDPARLSGYYLTEDQGARLGVFPISERLRYLVPFAEPAATLAHLQSWQGSAAGLTLVDDGEKFGLWPGTYTHVYEDGWLARFFESILEAGWVDLQTLGEFLDAHPPTGPVYLPTASYSEMGHWSLPTPAGIELEAARAQLAVLPAGEKLAALLRGGFWRTFLVKYPEVGDLYWKMLRLSQTIHQWRVERPDDARARAAQEALWRGQANDAYWHGVFGGCYLPHLRRAVKSALLEAERLAMEASAAPLWCRRDDANGDGRAEILIRTPGLSVTVQPERGGTLTEIGFLPKGLDVADVLTRVPEAYHHQIRASSVASGEGVRTIHDPRAPKEAGLDALLAYDRFRRASLLDGLFPPTGVLHPVEPWATALVALGGCSLGSRIRQDADSAQVEMDLQNPGGYPLSIQKSISVRGTRIDVTYRLRGTGDGRLDGRWAVQWNLTLTAGDAEGRYFRLTGVPALASRGSMDGLPGVAMIDEWAGVELHVGWSGAAHLGWGPVETVSISEDGFERIYQGTALLLAWPAALEPGQEWEEHISLEIETRS
jgi:alpha-amylase